VCVGDTAVLVVVAPEEHELGKGASMVLVKRASHQRSRCLSSLLDGDNKLREQGEQEYKASVLSAWTDCGLGMDRTRGGHARDMERV